MMETKKALIEWVPNELGGRSKPPLGTGTPPYSTVVRFTDEPWPHPSGCWSLAICKIEEFGNEWRWVADVYFRMEDAPHEALRSGREFELYEGGKMVAHGHLLTWQEIASLNSVALRPAEVSSSSMRSKL